MKCIISFGQNHIFLEAENQLGVSKNRFFPPNMDGLFHGKPYFLMDDLGGFPIFLVQHPTSFKVDGWMEWVHGDLTVCMQPTSSRLLT